MVNLDLEFLRDRYCQGIVDNVHYTLELITKTNNDYTKLDQDRGNILQSILDSLVYQKAAHIGLQCVLAFSNYMWQRGLWREWEEYVIQATILAKQLAKTEIAAKLITYRAGLQEALGRWPMTVSLAKEALSMEGDDETVSEGLFYMGTAYHNLGHYSAAFRTFLKALKSTSDRAREMAIKHKLARTLKSISIRDKAEKLLDEVLSWAVTENFEWLKAELMLDKAGILRQRDPKKALEMAEHSRRIYLELGFDRGIAYADLERARIYLTTGQVKESAEHLVQSKVLFERMGYLPGLAHANFSLGILQIKTRFYKRASTFLEESYRQAQRAGYKLAMFRAAVYLLLSTWKAGQWVKCGRMLCALSKLFFILEMPIRAKFHLIQVIREAV